MRVGHPELGWGELVAIGELGLEEAGDVDQKGGQDGWQEVEPGPPGVGRELEGVADTQEPLHGDRHGEEHAPAQPDVAAQIIYMLWILLNNFGSGTNQQTYKNIPHRKIEKNIKILPERMNEEGKERIVEAALGI